MALTQEQFFEQYWPTSSAYRDVESFIQSQRNRQYGQGVQQPSESDYNSWRESYRNAARQAAEFKDAWQIYSTEQQIADERTQQQEIQSIYSQILEQTRAQSETIQKQTTAALNQQKVLAQQEKLAAAQSQAPTTTTVTQRRRPTVGQPGVARTRLTAGTTVGGFSGTSPGRVNPTGLNI